MSMHSGVGFGCADRRSSFSRAIDADPLRLPRGAIFRHNEGRLSRGKGDTGTMDDIDKDELRARLLELRQRHQDLDAAIASLVRSAQTDQLRLTRLKKEKLRLKDEITLLEDKLLPDIIA